MGGAVGSGVGSVGVGQAVVWFGLGMKRYGEDGEAESGRGRYGLVEQGKARRDTEVGRMGGTEWLGRVRKWLGKEGMAMARLASVGSARCGAESSGRSGVARTGMARSGPA